MATAVKEGVSAADLIERCKAVKWEHRNLAHGVRFTLPTGEKCTVPETYPDAKALDAATNVVLKLGLEEAERAQRRSQETLDRIEEKERRTPAEQLANAAKKIEKSALSRAAGPYLTEFEEPGLHWFVAPHPAPQHKWVYLTEEICKFLLDQHNKPGAVGLPGTNRPQSEARIAYFRDLVISGQWMPVHQGMAMDRGGKGPGRVDDRPYVQDGQQRMAGIVAAAELIEMLRRMRHDGTTIDEMVAGSGLSQERIEQLLSEPLKVPVSFYVGMPLEYFAAVDDVKLREARDLFSMNGERNAATLQSATRLVIAHGSGNARAQLRKKSSNMTVVGRFEGGAEIMRRAASMANSHAKKAEYTTPSAFAAAYFLIASANGPDNRYVEAFFGGLLSGGKHNTRTFLDDDDPRKVYRRAMHDFKERGFRPLPMDQMGMIILAWNNIVKGLSPSKLRWSQKETPIPQVLVCLDRGETASAVPRGLVGEILDLDDQDEGSGE